MEDREYLIELYDIYGGLFNDSQRCIYEDYYFENLSLSEISENVDKSRNAIHKCIKNINNKLMEYENILSIYKKNKVIIDIISDLDDEDIKNKLEELL